MYFWVLLRGGGFAYFSCTMEEGTKMLKGSVEERHMYLFRCDFPSCSESAEIWYAYSLCVNPFTPESDQHQNSPAASQEYDITQYGELGFS